MIFSAMLMLINHSNWGLHMSYWHLIWTIIVDIIAWEMVGTPYKKTLR